MKIAHRFRFQSSSKELMALVQDIFVCYLLPDDTQIYMAAVLMYWKGGLDIYYQKSKPVSSASESPRLVIHGPGLTWLQKGSHVYLCGSDWIIKSDYIHSSVANIREIF